MDRAWEVFTEGLGAWWPLKDFSVGGAESEALVEGRVGGRIYERTKSGDEAEWGVLTVWEPQQRLAFTWHPGGPEDQATEVEVRFTAEGGSRTRLDLEHRGWEKLDGDALSMRDGYDQGWPTVLAPYVEAARG